MKLDKDKPIYHLHLVSDSTGDTLEHMAKSALVQFEGVQVKKHLWPLIRTSMQMERVMEDIKPFPGLVLYTVVNKEIRAELKRCCKKYNFPSVSVLDPVVNALTSFLGQKASNKPGLQYVLDADYFERMDAIQFSMAHDDGISPDHLDHAEVILVGVSRTSKTPTSIYMANRGIRTANVPFVPNCPMPEILDDEKDRFVVGLTVAPEQLINIRTHRLKSMNEAPTTAYVDPLEVRQEIRDCRRYCAKRGWPMIDVTRRSIEETAAYIISLYQRWQEERELKAGDGDTE